MLVKYKSNKAFVSVKGIDKAILTMIDSFGLINNISNIKAGEVIETEVKISSNDKKISELLSSKETQTYTGSFISEVISSLKGTKNDISRILSDLNSFLDSNEESANLERLANKMIASTNRNFAFCTRIIKILVSSLRKGSVGDADDKTTNGLWHIDFDDED